ncbi:GUN4 domain-containing protein, partial [Oscillatoriales cyanobacterium LEGE 11467]
SRGISYKTAWRQWKSGRLDGYQLPSGAIFVRVDPANIPLCLVCDTSLKSLMSASPLNCPVCGWVVSWADAKSLIEREQINWARKMWAKCQSGQSSNHDVAFSRLELRLDALQVQLQRATEERQYLQSQLDWVLEWLDRTNPDRIAQMLLNIETQSSEDFESTLQSEVGLDYKPLRELLVARQWRDADAMTRSLMLQGMQRETEGWLTPEDIEHFPPMDWQTLDWLWYEYSGGRFGFSVQQWMWQEVSGDYTAFCDRVGWRNRENWLYYDDVRFDIDAPAGHLPILGWQKRSCYGIGGGTAAEIMASLVAKSGNMEAGED